MPLLSDIAQKKKIRYFLSSIPKDSDILEVGSGSGWVGEHLRNHGWQNFQGIDLVPPADIVGDVRDWAQLNLQRESFDCIIAFEVVEHVDIYHACEALLRPKGSLLVTTPFPAADPLLKTLEHLGLNQKRTSPHDNLHHLKSVGALELVSHKIIAGLSQWGKFRKVAR